MLQVSRDNNLKIPKIIQKDKDNINVIDDLISTKKGLAIAKNKKYDE